MDPWFHGVPMGTQKMDDGGGQGAQPQRSSPRQSVVQTVASHPNPATVDI